MLINTKGVMEEQYTVKTAAFEGPLDLLLDLIQKRKLHISDISLAEITDDFMEYIKALEEFPTRQAADFILVASTLVLIKSRALLPSLDLSEEEEESIEDLEERLRLLKRMRELSEHVRERYGAAPLYFREPTRVMEPVFSPTREITKTGVHAAIQNVLACLPRLDILPQVVVRKVVSLEEMMHDLTKRVENTLATSFREFSKGRGTKAKADLIVSFLAMLELVKRGIITVRQDKDFEDIAIESGKAGTPRYL